MYTAVFCERSFLFIVSISNGRVLTAFERVPLLSPHLSDSLDGEAVVVSDQADTTSKLVEAEVYAGKILHKCDITVADLDFIKSTRIRATGPFSAEMIDDFKVAYEKLPAARRRGLNMAARALISFLKFKKLG